MTIRPMILPLAISLTGFAPALAAPSVAVDVAPLHSIVSRVMESAGVPDLILPPGASPHGYALRPSDAARLQDADVVFWIGPDLTPWLAEPLATLADGARIEAVADAPGVERLPVRAGGPFEAHDAAHGAEADHHHGEGDHPEAEVEHHDGDHAASAAEDDPLHAHAEADEHAAQDAHVWLDPRNATAFAEEIAATLAEADPANAERYRRNAAAFGAEMATLEDEIADALAPVREKPFIVFHDAYRHFEHRFDLPAAGSITLQEGVTPGAGRLSEIRGRVQDGGIVCAFAEPQFRPALLDTVVEGTGVRLGTLDPVGAGLEPGPALYPTLLRAMADNLVACLADG